MGQLIKHFPDGSFLEYDRGGFDDWCVYLTDASGKRKPPRDIDYFAQLRSLAERFGTDKVYNDYVKVYELTGKQVSKADLDCISRLSEEYWASANQVDTIFFYPLHGDDSRREKSRNAPWKKDKETWNP